MMADPTFWPAVVMLGGTLAVLLVTAWGMAVTMGPRKRSRRGKR